jgi:hypothetical protein
MRILTDLKGGPLVKLVKGEGRVIRACARRAVAVRRRDRPDRSAYALLVTDDFEYSGYW